MCAKPRCAAIAVSFGFSRYAAVSRSRTCGRSSYLPAWSACQNCSLACVASPVPLVEGRFSGANCTARSPHAAGKATPAINRASRAMRRKAPFMNNLPRNRPTACPPAVDQPLHDRTVKRGGQYPVIWVFLATKTGRTGARQPVVRARVCLPEQSRLWWRPNLAMLLTCNGAIRIRQQVAPRKSFEESRMRIDHLVWYSPDLGDGVRYSAERMDCAPAYGGVHPGVGT